MEASEKIRMKEHKKRMISKQKKIKQAQLDSILSSVRERIQKAEKLDISEPLVSFSSLFTQIPSLKTLLSDSHDELPYSSCESFWSLIPPCCTPDQAILDNATAPERLLKIEMARQNKYRRKLEKKVECGEISVTEMEKMFEKFGRENLEKNMNENVDTVGSFNLLNANRGLRKRHQVENIASLFEIFGEKKIVVDFGSGSGNLCLALASFYNKTTFVFVDQKEKSLEILSRRAEKGALDNIRVKQFTFLNNNLEDFIRLLKSELGATFDLGIGLHSCGRFTDLVMETCRLAKADCIIVPCCNGKINQELVADSEETYPRSAFISSIISESEYFLISRAADDESNYEAKCMVECDRACWAEENNFKVTRMRMEPITASPKHHVLYCSYSSDT